MSDTPISDDAHEGHGVVSYCKMQKMERNLNTMTTECNMFRNLVTGLQRQLDEVTEYAKLKEWQVKILCTLDVPHDRCPANEICINKDRKSISCPEVLATWSHEKAKKEMGIVSGNLEVENFDEEEMDMLKRKLADVTARVEVAEQKLINESRIQGPIAELAHILMVEHSITMRKKELAELQVMILTKRLGEIIDCNDCPSPSGCSCSCDCGTIMTDWSRIKAEEEMILHPSNNEVFNKLGKVTQ
jgi:hypothetical protein